VRRTAANRGLGSRNCRKELAIQGDRDIAAIHE
jgi:hypothetical protein